MATTPSILITGIDGFTGRYLADRMAGQGWQVHGVTTRPMELPWTTHTADLLDGPRLRDVVHAVRPTHVAHLAAISFVAHGDVGQIYNTNIVGTRLLLEALQSAQLPDLRCVLIASSANVYGNTTVDPIDELVPPQPANDYAVSKLAMEFMTSLWSDRLPITMVRPFNYTGVGQSAQFLIPKIVGAFAARSPVLELGNIDVERDFSDVRDVVEAYALLLQKAPQGVFNVCSGRALTLREVLELAQEVTGHAMEIRVNPQFVRANEVRRLRGSPGKLRSRIGVWQVRPMRETVQWMAEAMSRR